ncbi:MAG: hypothetical protein JSV29_04615 [Candidatus Bathyarchaeota archaeon]|nr:MAG: hypothetical protein JSV29_04615 [Candidatus Bathyarchaeota archaeon]
MTGKNLNNSLNVALTNFRGKKVGTHSCGEGIQYRPEKASMNNMKGRQGKGNTLVQGEEELEEGKLPLGA